MDSPDDPFDESVTGPTVTSLRESIAALKSLLVTVILAALILTGSFFVFLLREVTLIRRQVSEQAQYIGEFEKSMDDLKSRLQGFARSSPDFAPIMAKYFATNSAGPLVPPR